MAKPDAAKSGTPKTSRRLTRREVIQRTHRCLRPLLVSCHSRAEPRNDCGLLRRIPPFPPLFTVPGSQTRLESRECPRQPSMLVPSAPKAYPAATYSREDGMEQVR